MQGRARASWAGVIDPNAKSNSQVSSSREFTLSPNGKFVLIANQMSNEIVVVERDPVTGKLGKTLQKLAMDAPSDVKFIHCP